jgi:CRISPR-associated protein Cas2
MFYIVSYDIPHDRTRTRIASLCQAYGFKRIQFSVFAGEQTRNMVEMLAMEASDILGKRLGKVVVVPVCGRCYEKIIDVGENNNLKEQGLTTITEQEEMVMIV